MAYPASKLQHGDVLLYEHKSKQSILELGIRLVTGSKYVHCGVVQQDTKVTDGIMFVLEQTNRGKIHSWVPFYYDLEGEVIHVVRPRFKVPEVRRNSFLFHKYGYLLILDCIINHFMNRVTFNSWKYKTVFGRFTTKNICSSFLASEVLDLSKNTSWCYDPKLVEPDDFFNHSEDFEYLDVIDWEK